MRNVIFDLDDFAKQPERNCIHDLIKIKSMFHKFKVTLFAIPNYDNRDQSTFFYKIKELYGDWIQLAIHGWDHHDNFECSKWDYKTAKKYISKALDMGCFVNGFKAPGWQISRDTYKACLNLGLWVADHKESAYTEPGVPNSERRPDNLSIYEIDHPWMVHGHTWECVGNGIKTLIKQGLPFDLETNFYFIDDIVKGDYAKKA